MSSLQRTGIWLMVGASLILALSLGTRHGFGLFLSPMSADFGWGRGVFAFAIALISAGAVAFSPLPSPCRT
ncbi:MAG: major facilitator superfamily 1 [Pseudomonas sp.]|nr:major facilitator superfamily 1 [Pseudomonas sp.]